MTIKWIWNKVISLISLLATFSNPCVVHFNPLGNLQFLQSNPTQDDHSSKTPLNHTVLLLILLTIMMIILASHHNKDFLKHLWYHPTYNRHIYYVLFSIPNPYKKEYIINRDHRLLTASETLNGQGQSFSTLVLIQFVPCVNFGKYRPWVRPQGLQSNGSKWSPSSLGIKTPQVSILLPSCDYLCLPFILVRVMFSGLIESSTSFCISGFITVLEQHCKLTQEVDSLHTVPIDVDMKSSDQQRSSTTEQPCAYQRLSALGFIKGQTEFFQLSYWWLWQGITQGILPLGNIPLF